jgi:hypothetical protein
MKCSTYVMLVKHYAMQACGSGFGGIAPRILNLCSSWRWVVGFMHWSVYLRKEAPCTPRVRSSVGLKAGLGALEKWKFLRPCRQGTMVSLRIDLHCFFQQADTFLATLIVGTVRRLMYNSLEQTSLTCWRNLPTYVEPEDPWRVYPWRKDSAHVCATLFIPCSPRGTIMIDSTPVQTIIEFKLLRCNKDTPICLAKFSLRVTAWVESNEVEGLPLLIRVVGG